MSAVLLARSRAMLRNVLPYAAFPENQLPRMAALRILQPSFQASLVCLIGGDGVGKTHLCQFALQQLVTANPHVRFLFLAAAELVKALNRAAETNRLSDLHRFAKSLDALVIDDLHLLVGDGHAQRLVTHLLDETLDSGTTAVLLTMQRAPGELEGLSTRLVNRCHGGLCVTLRSPNDESRKELAKHLTAAWELPLSHEAIRELVAKTQSPRQLSMMLQRLKPAWEQSQHIETVRQLGTSEPADQVLSLWQVSQAVSEEFGVSLDDLLSRSRSAGLVLPRQCAMFLARTMTGLPLGKIGEYFGQRNHTTVSHGCERLQSRLESTPTLRQQVRRLRKRLQAVKKSS